MRVDDLTAYEKMTFLETLDTCRDVRKLSEWCKSNGYAPCNVNEIEMQAERNIASLSQLLGIRHSGEHVGQGSLTHCSTRTGRAEFVGA